MSMMHRMRGLFCKIKERCRESIEVSKVVALEVGQVQVATQATQAQVVTPRETPKEN